MLIPYQKKNSTKVTLTGWLYENQGMSIRPLLEVRSYY